MGEPHQIGIGPGRIDDDKIMGLLDCADRVGERAEFLRLDFVEAKAKAARHAKMPRMIELDAGAVRPAAAVLDVMREALLARIEIDGRYALTGL